MATIYVINPNSTQSVTDGIDEALDPLRSDHGPEIECLTLSEGPPGIQSQRDVDGVIVPLLKRAAALENRSAAFVIACFSDPGLHSLREQSARPVFGIAECGVLTALSIGQRFGVIAILPASIPRHLRPPRFERKKADSPRELLSTLLESPITLGSTLQPSLAASFLLIPVRSEGVSPRFPCPSFEVLCAGRLISPTSVSRSAIT